MSTEVQETTSSQHDAKLPVMCRPFDSYVSNGKIFIVTKEFSGKTWNIVEHEISTDRAKAIIADLQDAVRRACT